MSDSKHRYSNSWYRWPMCVCLAIVSSATAIAEDGTKKDAAAKIEFFERRIRPVLVEHCYECHSADSKKLGGKFRLDHKQALLKGGESGAAVVPGKPESGQLLSALRYDGLEMPPDKKLSESVIRDFEKWIADGAIDPRTEFTPDKSGTSHSQTIDLKKGRQFWSFQPPTRPQRPAVSNTKWANEPLDNFVLQNLERESSQPNPEADPAMLLRRVTFDLTGLPPSADEVKDFIHDDRPDAYQQVVDRLLASPHYGERVSRLWLDVARYAEDQAHIVGNNQSLFYPNAWMFRDWVISAFNDDMPFDRFIVLQLAADLLTNDEDKTNDSPEHVALGFLGLGPKYYRRNDPEVMADEWEDRVDTVTRGLMGLTVACARCHDHKYDPIPTEDYYGLAGVFANTAMYNKPLETTAKAKPKKGDKAKKQVESMHVVRDEKKLRDIPVYIRGDVNNKGDVVQRHFLQVISKTPVPLTEGSGRLPLARSIADANNPLTARVFVNRIWGMLTGQPIVGTASNFGVLGDRPTHPELLDELATEFVYRNWSVKQLQRQIVLSARYRQSSRIAAPAFETDPSNRLMWRMARRRLPVESIRDNLLSVAGQLDESIGGRSINPTSVKSNRRTIYSKVSRFELDKLLALFDFPDPNVHAAKRTETTTPLQKLFVMNSPLMNSFAKQLAEPIQSVSTEDRIHQLYQRVFGRDPSSDELKLGLEFLSDAEKDAWQQYAHALLACNEMMYLD